MDHTTSIINTNHSTPANESNISFSASHFVSAQLEMNVTDGSLSLSPSTKVFAGFCSAAGKLYLFGGRDQKDGNSASFILNIVNVAF
jgi:hypothetical protein